ncbi:hypothetical protein GCM10009119_21710 [Algoriphagus jejuensis]|uniref:eCIS core domain-containing protein n=1 Tax=Algoriphagus jejuensis TaxID=419934 RepID=A0ABP3YFD8_9BACT
MTAIASKENREKKKASHHPRTFFQAKLTVNLPGDRYEQEADAVADKISDSTNMDSGPVIEELSMQNIRPIYGDDIQKKCAECEEEETVQMKGNFRGGDLEPEIENRIQSAKGGGAAMPAETQTSMESHFGQPFGAVKIHNDNTSDRLNRQLDAKAFTTGNNIFFKRGEYNPTTYQGKKLLAHELTHVVQQGAISWANIQRDEEESTPQNAEEDEFEFDYDLLPPSLQFSIGQWILEANTSRVALQFSQGLMRSRFGYNYGGNLTLGTRTPSLSTEFGFNPHSPALSFGLTQDRFRFGANADLTTGGFGFNLGYGAKLLPMPFDLAGPVNAGWAGASGILGDIGNMQDPVSFYQAHGDDIDAIMGSVKALQPLADESNQGFGAGLRFTYNPTTGVLIHAGVQWMF